MTLSNLMFAKMIEDNFYANCIYGFIEKLFLACYNLINKS